MAGAMQAPCVLLDGSLLESAQRGQGGIKLEKFSVGMLLVAVQVCSVLLFCLQSLCSGIPHRQGVLCRGEQVWAPLEVCRQFWRLH